MSQLTGETLKNLPPVDAPNVDTGAFIKAAKDSASSLASAAGGELPESLSAGNVPNITNVNLITNKLGQAAGGLSSGLGDLSVASLTDKLSSAQGSLNSVVAAGAPLGLSPAKLGLGSVESNASAIGSLVQGSAGAATALSKSATSLFGSSRTQSPLDKLIANNNADNNNWGEG
jgi:hypothetical protein